jgi:hypothetical protein
MSSLGVNKINIETINVNRFEFVRFKIVYKLNLYQKFPI